MLILETISLPTLWGGQKLYSYGGDTNIEKLGQLYTIAADDELSNRILNGKYKGDNLRDVYRKNPQIFGENAPIEFPLLIGFVDARENLSLQVHPNNEYCKQYEGKEMGKCESWIFIEPPTSGEIYNGCKTKTRELVQENIHTGNWDNIIDTLPVKKDQYVYVEAGTLHALTAGSLVYEIQQSTNLTYRFYDYDRVDKLGNKRPLHLDKALDVLDTEKKSLAENIQIGERREEEYYNIMLYNIEGQFKNNSDTYFCITVLEGSTTLDEVKICKGMSFILFSGEEIYVEDKLKCVIASSKI